MMYCAGIYSPPGRQAGRQAERQTDRHTPPHLYLRLRLAAGRGGGDIFCRIMSD